MHSYLKPHISVAPMMDWTDRHCRYFHRLISPNVVLYTEMVTTGAIIYGDRDRFLRFNSEEHPVVLQLGGSEPDDLATCAKIGEDYGYDGIDLNCGCPSERVQKGAFGACLMKEPELVAECVDKMQQAVSIPVSVKCRIGVDECDELSFLNRFIEDLSKVNCQKFTIHARKALLKGLSPKENREVPPLRYDIVRAVKEAHQNLEITLNGGIKTLKEIENHLLDFDGVMIGREAYQSPYLLAGIEHTFFDNDKPRSREEVAMAMVPYIAEQERLYGTPEKSITRHMMGLFKGLPGGAKWRRALSERASIPEALEIMRECREIAA